MCPIIYVAVVAYGRRAHVLLYRFSFGRVCCVERLPGLHEDFLTPQYMIYVWVRVGR